MSHVLTMPALDWRILSIDFHVQVTTCKVLISQLRFIAIVQFVCYLLLHCCALPICMYTHITTLTSVCLYLQPSDRARLPLIVEKTSERQLTHGPCGMIFATSSCCLSCCWDAALL